MNYQQFIIIMQEKTNQLLGKDVNVHIHSALKNNGKERIGLTITQCDLNISPTIYLEEYFTQYQNGRPLGDIAGSIVSLYYEVKFDHSWEVERVQDFQRAKSNLACKLIHFKKNETLLREIPYVPYLDFAVVFYLLLETTERGTATILITHDMLKYWNLSVDELYQLALQNTSNILPADFLPMRAVICELLKEPYPQDNCEESHMYILTNQYRHFGAACILYNRVLEDIGNQLNENFYILPSSIHEVIILPESFSPGQSTLNEMIVEINETQVSEEEVLSDHAYYYCRQERSLK